MCGFADSMLTEVCFGRKFQIKISDRYAWKNGFPFSEHRYICMYTRTQTEEGGMTGGAMGNGQMCYAKP